MSEITVNIKPQPKQYLCYQKLFDDTTRFVGFGGGAGGGKTWLGCEWLLMNCYRYPGSKWFIGRKELKRLMASTFVTWTKVCKFHNIPASDWKLDGKYNVIIFENGSKIDLLDVSYQPSDPMYERFGSMEYTGGWGEEVGEWHFLAFDVLKSRIGRWMNIDFGLLPPKFLLTFNPTKNWLYRIFYKEWKAGTLSKDYCFIQSLFADNQYTAKEYGEQLNLITDAVNKARLRDGLWEYEDDATALIQYDAIVDLFTNAPIFSNDLYLTADVARFGSDRTVYTLWRGLDAFKMITKERQGIDTTITDIRTLLRDYRIPYSHCAIDEDGVGGGVVDHLAGVRGFVNNSAPIKTRDVATTDETKKENYRNLKTQCSFVLADKVNRHELSISAELSDKDKDLLAEELGQIKRKITDDVTTLQIISKEEVKESLGRSPDLSDTLMMRMLFELDKPKKFYNPTTQLGFGGVANYI